MSSSSLEVKYALDMQLLTIGELSDRSGIAASALRYYETEGLLHSTRSSGNQRRYHRDALRRVGFVRVAQEVGLSLAEIKEALSSLPDERTPTEKDWARLSASWQPRIDHQIRVLERLRDRLSACIGCGCLSLKVCRIVNADDRVAIRGPGPRYVLDDED
jgi:MerR family redox-sensitive transcriptional activator SoxR